MNIFFIILINICITGVAVGIPTAIKANVDFMERKDEIIALIFACIIFICGTLIGIGINTENERIFVAKYIAQKQTIEESLEVEELSGFERIELVNKATELNGEMAKRKAEFELWYFVVYDNSIYDDVQPIRLKKAVE